MQSDRTSIPAATVPVPSSRRLPARTGWASLPFAAFVTAVPDPADDEDRHRRLSDTRMERFTLDNIRGLFTPVDHGRLLDLHQDQPGLGHSRLPHRLLASPAAVVLGGLPQWIRGPLLTFSGVASNFAGVPLAFAFLATLGRVGLVTVILQDTASASICVCCGLQPPVLLGPDAHLPVFPDPADGADHHAGARRAEARMARGRRNPRRHQLRSTGAWSRFPILLPSLARHACAAVRQCLRRGRHRLSR